MLDQPSNTDHCTRGGGRGGAGKGVGEGGGGAGDIPTVLLASVTEYSNSVFSML